jgi:hypothetical protein
MAGWLGDPPLRLPLRLRRKAGSVLAQGWLDSYVWGPVFAAGWDAVQAKIGYKYLTQTFQLRILIITEEIFRSEITVWSERFLEVF